MNGGPEGWSMIRCAGGAHDKSVMNRIMLRFRPIAPKPSGSGSDGTGLGSDHNNNSKISSLYSNGMIRKKRKYVRVRRNSGYTRKKKPASISRENNENNNNNNNNGRFDVDDDRTVMTLQLLPEKIDLNRSDLISNNNSSSYFVENHEDLPMWKRSDQSYGESDRSRGTNGLVVHTWVTVECVTGTCMVDDNRDFGSSYSGTDMESVKRNLEKDTCPGFISDGSNSVLWVNAAFKRMVVKEEGENNNNDGLLPEIRVVLVIKEKLPSFYSSLTGHVKLHYYYYYYENEKNKYSRVIVPCDLWRMDGGGFAWRLDVEAALTLGR